MLQIDLTGKIAVVTGGAGQLGRVMVRTLARCGADVAISYLSSEAKAQELKSEIEAMGRRAITVRADVTQENDVFAMRDTIGEQLGAPQIIVNNAVIQYTPWTSVMEQPVDDYESQFRSCVLHNVLMAKAFVPAMVKAKYGRIIGINTECAAQVLPNQSAYVSGKRGMDGVMRCLAKEVGPHGVTVNQVAPGWTISETDRDAGGDRDTSGAYSKNVPMKRRGTDQEIANAVAFLARFVLVYHRPLRPRLRRRRDAGNLNKG
jgi:3-oxoacyl-[acyl-carrier protein] reductase